MADPPDVIVPLEFYSRPSPVYGYTRTSCELIRSVPYIYLHQTYGVVFVTLHNLKVVVQAAGSLYIVTR